MDADGMEECTNDPSETKKHKSDIPSPLPSASTSRAKELKSEFEKAICPQKVINPKENDIPHDEYPAYKKNSLIHSKELNANSDDESHELSEFGKKVQKELELQSRSIGERRPREKPGTSTCMFIFVFLTVNHLK